VLEFRASIVIGPGSLSFELIRALFRRLPVMVCPRGVSTVAQPIAIEDLLAYLVAAAELPPGLSEVFEVGGSDRVSYGQLMQEYARQCGLRRWLMPVPLLSPCLSSLWLGLVTPACAPIGRQLVESLRNPTVVNNFRALEVFDIRPRGVREAIATALEHEDRGGARSHWSDTRSAAPRPRPRGRCPVGQVVRRFTDGRCAAGC
jgi:nucleoside-diphosphate-sugar epimerase